MSLFRSQPIRINYGELRTAWSSDELIVATAIAAGVLGVCWLLITPTFKKQRSSILINIAYAFSIFVAVVAIRQSRWAETRRLATRSPMMLLIILLCCLCTTDTFQWGWCVSRGRVAPCRRQRRTWRTAITR
jgi:hypothetical protein